MLTRRLVYRYVYANLACCISSGPLLELGKGTSRSLHRRQDELIAASGSGVAKEAGWTWPYLHVDRFLLPSDAVRKSRVEIIKCT